MELNLDAVAKALEKMMSPVSTSAPPNRDSHEKGRPHNSIRRPGDSRLAASITSPTHKKNLAEDNGTQEILLPRMKAKMPPRPQKKFADRFAPSPTSILCNVVEATGIGASSVMCTGKSSSRRFGEKVWTVNLYQYPKPYVVLNSLPRHYFRKEAVSYIESTDHMQGERIERVRDVVLTIVVEPSTENLEVNDESANIVEGVVVSCSNHPRTGYVNVVHMKDIKSPLVRIILPGTLVGPFLKLTFLPKGILQSKVLKVSVIELAHADSWTQRRVVEEPLRAEGVVDEIDDLENVNQIELKHVTSSNFVSVKEHGTQVQENVSAMQDSGSVSSVKSAQEDSESINEKIFAKETHENVKEKHGKQRTKDSVSLVPPFEQRKKEVKIPQNREKSPLVLDEELRKSDKQMLCTDRKAASILPSDDIVLRSEVKNEKLYHSAALKPLVDGPFEDDKTSNGAQSTESVSKAMIAWSVQRRLLQDKSVIEMLKKDHSGSNFVKNGKSSDEGKMHDYSTIGKDSQRSFQLSHARSVWESATYWSRRDVLLEAMMKSTAICVTIARSQNEVLASLPQSYPLHILLLLHDVQPSDQDCFDLMMTVAYAERRCGRDAELVCRMTDGFLCALHSRHRADTTTQWLLVSQQNYYTHINEWITEILRVHDYILLQSEKNLRLEKEAEENGLSSVMYDDLETSILKPPTLRSVFDFAGIFETILPVLRPWLAKNNLHYYGDVQPALKPFIEECGIIRSTSWFQCVLQATLRSVVLDFPEANEVLPINKSTTVLMPMHAHTSAQTVRRCFVCAVLHQHIPFFAVWQPELQAVRVVLTTAHVLHHIDFLNGLMTDDVGLRLVRALTPHNSGKVHLIEDDFSLRNSDSVVLNKVYSDGRESTSPLAFQLLGTALRNSWSVVGLTLPVSTSKRQLFDEDAFMDTVMRWGYAFPRTIVLFFCEAEESTCFSARFIGAFAPVEDLHSALRT